MPVVDDAEKLGKRTGLELEMLSDFVLHTDRAWDALRLRVSEGHNLQVQNNLTGKDFAESDLVARSRQYLSHYLLAFSFQHLAAVFEAFFFDLLKAILVNNPVQLAQKKQIEVGFALSAPDRQALINLIAERELNEVKYRKPSDWFQYLDGLVHLGCPSADEIASFAEMKACRDTLAHNAGVANPVYIDKAGTKARWTVGERVIIEWPYFQECWKLAGKMIADMVSAVKRELAGR